MADAHFMTMRRAQIEDGSWFEPVRAEWARGRVALVRVEPEESGDPELRAAIETMLESNGSYKSGDQAVVHARPAALAMGCETAHILRERGITTEVILGIGSMAKEVRALLEAVYAAETEDGAPMSPEAFAQADTEELGGIVAAYRHLLAPMEAGGRAHWIVPVGTSPDPDPGDVPALDLYSRVALRGLSPIGRLRAEGKICSQDIWLTPTELDVARLNEDLPAERHWTLDEWCSLIFRSMAVSADRLRELAMEIEGVRLTIEASLRGGTLRYQRDDGTDMHYRVTGRPVILDCGRIGTNSLGGTPAFGSPITNQPTTEVFVAPIEDSLSGVIAYTVPERTVHGVVRAPYRIEVHGGKVVRVTAPDKDSVRILRHYTGLEPYDGRKLSGDEGDAFRLRRAIAEMAIAGFNPAMLPEIQSGRLRPVTGLVLTDEKLGDHQAFGSNDQFMGATPSALGDHHVEHTDFVGGIARKMTLEG